MAPLADYALFLQLAPQDPTQRPSIEKVMALLRQAQDDKEKSNGSSTRSQNSRPS